jgi:cyclopropane-fatty-acyl-phospholipid synthase
MAETMKHAASSPPAAVVSLVDRFARRVVLSLLRRIESGTLTIGDAWGEQTSGSGEPAARISVSDIRLYRKVLTAGSLGSAEAYMNGWWRADDLAAVARIFVRNLDVLNRMDFDWGRITAPFHKVVHRLRRNTPGGSRRNIGAHYDLSNEFFSLFLDRTMAYSCGVFEGEGSSLEEASLAKFERFCTKLDLSSSDRLLEIGGGWGGFAIHAARTRGCRVTTVTISERQYEFSRRRVAEEGLGDLVEVLLRDYRRIEGRYSKLVSIEMIEAVGHQYLEEFFRCCSEHLEEDGVMGLQAITVRRWISSSGIFSRAAASLPSRPSARPSDGRRTFSSCTSRI